MFPFEKGDASFFNPTMFMMLGVTMSLFDCALQCAAHCTRVRSMREGHPRSLHCEGDSLSRTTHSNSFSLSHLASWHWRNGGESEDCQSITKKELQLRHWHRNGFAHDAGLFSLLCPIAMTLHLIRVGRLCTALHNLRAVIWDYTQKRTKECHA